MLTFRFTSHDVDLIVTSAVMSNPLHAGWKGINELSVECTVGCNRAIMTVDSDCIAVLPTFPEVRNKLCPGTAVDELNRILSAKLTLGRLR